MMNILSWFSLTLTLLQNERLEKVLNCFLCLEGKLISYTLMVRLHTAVYSHWMESQTLLIYQVVTGQTFRPSDLQSGSIRATRRHNETHHNLNNNNTDNERDAII